MHSMSSLNHKSDSCRALERWTQIDGSLLIRDSSEARRIFLRPYGGESHPLILHPNSKLLVNISRLEVWVRRRTTLKRDKQLLKAELVKLRQEQRNMRVYLKAMKGTLQRMEQKQRQMMAFLTRIMQNPNFLQQLVHENERRWELQEAIAKKRRRPIDRAPEHDDV